jgi:hypothetical protein
MCEFISIGNVVLNTEQIVSIRRETQERTVTVTLKNGSEYLFHKQRYLDAITRWAEQNAVALIKKDEEKTQEAQELETFLRIRPSIVEKMVQMGLSENVAFEVVNSLIVKHDCDEIEQKAWEWWNEVWEEREREREKYEDTKRRARYSD